MIKDFLAKLGANTRTTVGVSVSPGVGLEMIEVDKNTKSVSKYACRPLDYNYSSREITDYGQFQQALGELFEELHIPAKSNVVLNLPNVEFGVISLPLLLTDDAVTNAIISEVEQSYIFKRQEPIVSWVEISSNIDTENRELAYTAIQQTAMDGIQGACEEIGCSIVAVECSYASLLKTLYYSEIAKDQMKEGITWNLMIIGQNSYSILSMVGKKIIEYYEEPLALKSFVDDEIYNAITSSAQLTLAGLPANYLFIVSETDLVSSEVLSMKIPFEGMIKFLECNKYTQNEVMPVNLNILPNLALKISPEAIGIGVYQICDFPVKFNLTGQKESFSTDSIEAGGYPRITVANVEVELTPDFLKKLSIVVGVLLAVPLLIIMFLVQSFLGKEQEKLSSLETRIQNANAEIQKYNAVANSTAFDAASSISKISSQNRLKLLYYGALGMSIPNKLWITYYMTNSEEGVDIKGKANSVDSVYEFYKGVKQTVINSNVRLHKLEVVSSSIDDVLSESSDSSKYYEFEITNMTPEELNPPPPGSEQAAQPQEAPKEEKKSIFQVGKPLFGPKPEDSGAPNQNPPPQQQQPPQQAPQQLPKNLEKIEKF